jgi:hypothetical protein
MSPFCRACMELVARTIKAVNEDGVPAAHIASLSCATNALARVVWHVLPATLEIEAWILPNGSPSRKERRESALALIVCPFASAVKPTMSKTIVRVPISAATSDTARYWAGQVLDDLSVEGELCGW